MGCWADGLQDRNSQGTLSWVLDFPPTILEADVQEQGVGMSSF